MKVWWLLLCFSLVLATSARAQQAASTAEQIVSEARARIAAADAFACDLQDKACLSQELIMRSDNDQWIRGLLGPLCGFRDECNLWQVMGEIDHSNAQRVDSVLRVHGWPSGEGWDTTVEEAVFHISITCPILMDQSRIGALSCCRTFSALRSKAASRARCSPRCTIATKLNEVGRSGTARKRSAVSAAQSQTAICCPWRTLNR